MRKVFLIGIVLAYSLRSEVWAQNQAAGVGISVPVVGEVANGSVICASGVSFGMCNTSYSPDILGVVADNAAVALEASDPQTQRLVVTDGVVKVRVSTEAGPIAEGEFLTSSDNPGVAVVAGGNGYVLGSALESYTADDPEAIGQIAVAINIHLKSGFTGGRTDLWYLIRQGLSSSVFEPLDSLRYLLAALVVIISFTLGVVYFGRVTQTGVEALGRNPLAKASIRTGIVLSILLSFVMILAGLGLAYLILIL